MKITRILVGVAGFTPTFVSSVFTGIDPIFYSFFTHFGYQWYPYFLFSENILNSSKNLTFKIFIYFKIHFKSFLLKVLRTEFNPSCLTIIFFSFTLPYSSYSRWIFVFCSDFIITFSLN